MDIEDIEKANTASKPLTPSDLGEVHVDGVDFEDTGSEETEMPEEFDPRWGLLGKSAEEWNERLGEMLEETLSGIGNHSSLGRGLALRSAAGLTVTEKVLKDELRTLEPSNIVPLEFVIERCDPDTELEGWLSPKRLLERSVRLRPRVSREMLLTILASGGSVRGAAGRSFSISVGRQNAVADTINRTLRAIPTCSLETKDTLKKNSVGAGARQKSYETQAQQSKIQGLLRIQAASKAHSMSNAHGVGDVSVSFRPVSYDTNGGLALRFLTAADHPLLARYDFAHQWTKKATAPPAELYPEEALAFAAEAENCGVAVRIEEGLDEGLKSLIGRFTVARAVEGLPGRAHVVEPVEYREGSRRLSSSREVPTAAALVALKKAKQQGRDVALDPAAADALRMEGARPALDGDLLAPQRIPVGRGRATQLGFVNASMVGTGKTAMTLIAERGRAKALPGYRMLLVCSSSLVSQWIEEEFPKFWPACQRELIDSQDPAGSLSRLDRDWGDTPGCFVVTYDTARRQTEAVMSMTYDTVIMEEAGRLGSPNTQLSRAMWRIRDRSKVGIALTATPFRKSSEELDSILAWSRADRFALKTKPLSRRYGSFDQMSLRRLTESLGPAFVRVTREQMAEHMPDVSAAEHRLIDLTPSEVALRDAIEDHIASLYGELLEKVKAATAMAPDSPELAEAQRELQSNRGLVLSTISLAQQAALDPEILRSSNSLAVSVLEASGVVESAIQGGSTKRTIVSDAVAAAEADDEQTLVFSQSVVGLNLLAEDLKNRHGVHAPVYCGAMGSEEADRVRSAFQRGEIRTLLLSPIAKEGLNLPASIVLHYDLPWVPADFEQRIGRATRTGSAHRSVAILIPIMKNTIEERVCQHLVPRAAQADAMLNVAGTPMLSDNGDVVAGEGSTELAMQLGGIADEMAGREDSSLRMRIAAQIFAERRGE